MIEENHAWQGWVFQLDFFTQLKHAKDTNTNLFLVNPGTQKEKWEAKGIHYYSDQMDICGPRIGAAQFENKLKLKVGDWLISTRWML